VVFTWKAEWNELGLDEIPARLFSGTMRDLDLVVSVAHRGGVDPEATASTVESKAHGKSAAPLRRPCRRGCSGHKRFQPRRTIATVSKKYSSMTSAHRRARRRLTVTRLASQSGHRI